MKKISTAISIIVALIATISCSEKPVIPESTDSYVQVKLGFTGEAPNITTTPMTKADDAKDWYQIQVYSAPVGTTRYSYYGYGFFNNTEKVSCDKQGRVLLAGHLKDYANLKKDIVIAGVSNRLEIWDAEEFDNMNNLDNMNVDEITAQMETLGL